MMDKKSIQTSICGLLSTTIIIISIAIFQPTPSPAAQIIDGPVAREKFRRDVQDLLNQQKFGELEMLAKRLRTTKARFPEGHWQLMYFYEGLSSPPRGGVVQPRPKWKWDRHFALLDKWQREFSASVTPRVVAANAWMEYGWEARGGGFASTVTEEGWRLLSERMKQAVAQPNATPADPAQDCPERFHTLLVVGKVEGWPREKFMALFKAAIAFEPGYYPLYATASDYLAPRWHGEGNEWLDFLEKADAVSGDPDGREIYARMVPSFLDEEWSSFDDPRISWSKIKKGYRDMEKRYPGSPYNLNNFAKYACMAGDMETARELLKKVGETPYLKAWQEPFKVYDECIRAAGVGGLARAALKESQESVQARALAERGDKYSQYMVGKQFLQGSQWEKPDKGKGMALVNASAEQGFPPAIAEVGIMYWNTTADKCTALSWMERAALLGDDVRYGLPRNYEQTRPGNLVKAYAWHSYNGDEDGRKEAERISKLLTPEQLTEAQREAVRIRQTIEAMP